MLWEKKMEIELEKAIYVKAHQNPPCPFWVSEAAPMVDEDWDKDHWNAHMQVPRTGWGPSEGAWVSWQL